MNDDVRPIEQEDLYDNGRVYQGFGLDFLATNQALALIERIAAMEKLGLIGAVVWEGDDGPEAYATVESMVEYAYNAGGRVLRLNTFDNTQFSFDQPTRKVIPCVSAGKFLYINE